MSLKNKWRRVGRLEFRRETARLSDGTPEGYDKLYVRIKGKACVIFGMWNGPRIDDATMYLLAGTYRLGRAGKLTRLAKEYFTSRHRD